MINNQFQYISYSQIIPSGWIHDKLNALKEGLTGNIQELWEDVGITNAWLGGSGNSWERGPYYIDGLIPLSLLLKDRMLEEKALHWIRSVIKSQKADGWFGPSDNDDWWPRMIMLKALIQYADARPEAPEANSILTLCKNFFKYFDSAIEKHPLKMWAYARGMETYVSLIWTYNKTEDPFYLHFAKKIASLSLPWDKKFFQDIPIKKPIEEYMPWKSYKSLMSEYKQTSDQATLIDTSKYSEYFYMYHLSHIVNVAMSVKYLVYEYQLSHDELYLVTLKKGIHQLYSFHGQANGMFSGDEHISGTNPSRGTELCAVVELLYSLEEAISITGDLSFCDLLEQVAYNALLTTISQDCCSHQYNQQVNQIACTVDKRLWYNNANDCNTFGLVPYFGCCAANMHQGWPKFVRSFWMKKENGLVCLTYAPTIIQIQDVRIEVKSSYPFIDVANIYIHSSRKESFSLELNIPKWATEFLVTVNNYPINYQRKSHSIEINRVWGEDILHISFNFSVEFVNQNDGISIYRGPVLFALPIEEEKSILHERGKFSDLEYRPKSKWNYGISKDTSWTVEYESAVPVVHGTGYIVNNWKIEENSAGVIPKNPDVGGSENIHLIPYGLSVLRVAVFPEVRTSKK